MPYERQMESTALQQTNLVYCPPKDKCCLSCSDSLKRRSPSHRPRILVSHRQILYMALPETNHVYHLRNNTPPGLPRPPVHIHHHHCIRKNTHVGFRTFIQTSGLFSCLRTNVSHVVAK